MQYLYWTIQVMNGIVFTVLDLCEIYADISNGIKFFSIVLCFLYAIQGKSHKRSAYLCAGLFFTVIADYCLIIKNDSLQGVIFFSIVQTIYSIYVCKDGKTLFKKLTVTVTGAYLLIIVLEVVMKIQVEVLLVFIAYYFISIVSNCYLSIKRYHESLERKLFAIGMILFLCCDINVGLMNMGDFISSDIHVLDVIYPVVQVAIWIYYLPSQLIIAYCTKGRIIKIKMLQ